MASELRVTTIANNAGSESVDTTYVVNGSVKQWCVFDGTAGTLSLDDSLNTSSLTDLSTGNYNSNYTTNMSSTDFVSHGDADALRDVNCEAITSSYYRIRVFGSNNSAADQSHTRGAVLGDLA